MYKNIKSIRNNSIEHSNQGFTIIEVLIVLAIAGLILLIVFLAVPALQRNSRNTQRRTEAARLLAVTSEFVNNNGGIVPNTTAGVISCSGLGGGATNCDLIPATNNAQRIWQLANPKNLSWIVIQVAGQTGTPLQPTLTDPAKDIIETQADCSGTYPTTATYTPAAAAPLKSTIVIYAIEDAAGQPLAQCIESSV